MTFSTKYRKTTKFTNTFTKFNIRTTPSHICCYSNSTFFTGMRNNISFSCMLFSI